MKTCVAHFLVCLNGVSLFFAQQTDSIHPKLPADSVNKTTPHPFFKEFSGGMNFYFQEQPIKTGLDLSAHTYHYFLVTGKKRKPDSLSLTVSGNEQLQTLYRGLDFFVLNRAVIDFQSLKYMANSYFTSLQPSPLTLRLVRSWALGKTMGTELDFSPAGTLRFLFDTRMIPYQQLNNDILLGLSAHLYLLTETIFKRLEFNERNEIIDQGQMSIRPAFGISLANRELRETLFVDRKQKILLSSECRIAFKSDRDPKKNYAFTLRYNLQKVLGPRISFGLLLTSA